jgi:acyl-CoA thioester hydrolase
MKIEIPEKKKQVFEMVIPIRWGDMDAMGHLNNGSYFRYLETVRIDWMYSLGKAPDPKGQGMVIVNAFCNFYKQLEYPGNVRATMYVSPGVVYAAGGATTIWVDFPSQKALTLPDWVRALVS